MGEVVDPREEHAEEEEDGWDGDSFAQGLDRILHHVPTDDDLNNEVGKKTKVGSSRTNFWLVRQQSGRRKVAGNTGEDVDQSDSKGADVPFNVSHEAVLEDDTCSQVNETSMEEERDPETRKLVRDIFIHKLQHPTDILQTGDLGTKGCLFMEISVDELAVILCQNLTLSMSSKTTRLGDQLTRHVLGMKMLPLSSTADLYRKVTSKINESNR